MSNSGGCRALKVGTCLREKCYHVCGRAAERPPKHTRAYTRTSASHMPSSSSKTARTSTISSVNGTTAAPKSSLRVGLTGQRPFAWLNFTFWASGSILAGSNTQYVSIEQATPGSTRSCAVPARVRHPSAARTRCTTGASSCHLMPSFFRRPCWNTV